MGVGPLLEVFICPKNSLKLKTLGPEWGEGCRVPPAWSAPVLLEWSNDHPLACGRVFQEQLLKRHSFISYLT